ncbi:hypothetical protein [Mucilaginibacter arboris]|uniref:Uncharacterized protein n=1 Tax=Mucilaginibacter arboris TaxID=2682090 RepID=A0A7K1SY74_9SPHI|nr:hypothetical protein [Mucilaginibacter arboris]MVN22274.1 hypothetical protein [Mucilaginibacter arboris]
MNEVFLEIVPARFTAADFEKHQLPMPVSNTNDVFKMIFFTEADYCKYLKELETTNTIFLSQYWIVKTQDLIDKNRFIIAVLTTLTIAKSKKYSCLN